MNWLDVVLVLPLILTGLIGFVFGLISTLVPLIGLVIGIAVAGEYYVGFANNILSSHADGAYVGAFIIIVLLFLIAAVVVAVILHDLLEIVFLDWLNHLAGLLLGVILGILVSGAILSVLLKQSVGVSTISDSSVAAFVVDKFPFALSLLSGDFDTVKKFFD